MPTTSLSDESNEVFEQYLTRLSFLIVASLLKQLLQHMHFDNLCRRIFASQIANLTFHTLGHLFENETYVCFFLRNNIISIRCQSIVLYSALARRMFSRQRFWKRSRFVPHRRHSRRLLHVSTMGCMIDRHSTQLPVC